MAWPITCRLYEGTLLQLWMCVLDGKRGYNGSPYPTTKMTSLLSQPNFVII